jgi:hypothetical protein
MWRRSRIRSISTRFRLALADSMHPFGSCLEGWRHGPGCRAQRGSLWQGDIFGYAQFCDGIHRATLGHTGTTGVRGRESHWRDQLSWGLA